MLNLEFIANFFCKSGRWLNLEIAPITLRDIVPFENPSQFFGV